MPYLNATLYVPPSAELTSRVIAALTGEVNRALQSLLGEASGYVVVEELAADSWGYTGETQEAHYLRDDLRIEGSTTSPHVQARPAQG